MRRLSLTIFILCFVIFLTGCASESQKIKELESKVDSLEKEKNQIEQEAGKISSKKEPTSKIGTRSNPVPLGDKVTFKTLFGNSKLKLTVKITDVKRGNEAEDEAIQSGFQQIGVDVYKRDMKSKIELITYTISIKSNDVDKDKGIQLPDYVENLTTDGNMINMSSPLPSMSGFNESGVVYVDGLYQYRMLGQIEKGKGGLVSLMNLDSNVFFEIE